MAGVAGGFSRWTGLDPTLVRIGFVLLGLATGVGVAVYVVAWLVLPVEGDDTAIAARAVTDHRGIALALTFLPLLVALEVVGAVAHAGFVASAAWPIVLSAAGLGLIWRNADDEERARLQLAARPLLDMSASRNGSHRGLLARIVLGVVLLGAGLVMLTRGHHDTQVLRPVAGALLVIGAIVVVFGPWWLRAARDLVSERQARIRAEERADMAAQVHDSVLQTLVLIERSAQDPQRVVQLARSSEREVRSWLLGGSLMGSLGVLDGGDGGPATLGIAVQRVAGEVEAAHGITVDAVTVGDCPLDDDVRALLEAAREALVNAAKWSGAPGVSIYAEVEARRISVYVRDRGVGFDPAAVAPDRRGISESISARMRRHGGSASIRTSPGEGTEVELSLVRKGERG